MGIKREEERERESEREFTFVLVCSQLLAFRRDVYTYIYILCMCVYICTYVGLRFKSNPVLTLPHVPRFDRRGNNARNIVGQLILFFFLPLSREDHRVLRFYPAPLLSRDTTISSFRNTFQFRSET